jgi:hypothetical protein
MTSCFTLSRFAIGWTRRQYFRPKGNHGVSKKRYSNASVIVESSVDLGTVPRSIEEGKHQTSFVGKGLFRISGTVLMIHFEV